MQLCPLAAKMPAITPFTALSRSASAKTIFGDLPPISSVTRALRRAASAAITCPVAVDPVNAIFATPGWATSAAPARAPPVQLDIDHAIGDARVPD